MDDLAVRLRPMAEEDLVFMRRLATDPAANGPDWYGFRDAGAAARRFATDGYLGTDDGRLVVECDRGVAGFVSWVRGGFGVSRYWIIGIALLPEMRGRGVGWRAQVMLCDYLFAHTPTERIEAGTQPENVAEQRSLEKAGFRRDGVLRSADFRAGRWRDLIIYSRLRGEPAGG